jgi:hypothetical protein
MEPIAYVADAESVFVFQNETRPTSAPSTHIGQKEWNRQRLRLSQSVEVRPSREPRQKDPHHQPELSVEGDPGQQRNCRIARQGSVESGPCFPGIGLWLVVGCQLYLLKACLLNIA